MPIRLRRFHHGIEWEWMATERESATDDYAHPAATPLKQRMLEWGRPYVSSAVRFHAISVHVEITEKKEIEK